MNKAMLKRVVVDVPKQPHEVNEFNILELSMPGIIPNNSTSKRFEQGVQARHHMLSGDEKREHLLRADT